MGVKAGSYGSIPLFRSDTCLLPVCRLFPSGVFLPTMAFPPRFCVRKCFLSVGLTPLRSFFRGRRLFLSGTRIQYRGSICDLVPSRTCFKGPPRSWAGKVTPLYPLLFHMRPCLFLFVSVEGVHGFFTVAWRLLHMAFVVECFCVCGVSVLVYRNLVCEVCGAFMEDRVGFFVAYRCLNIRGQVCFRHVLFSRFANDLGVSFAFGTLCLDRRLSRRDTRFLVVICLRVHFPVLLGRFGRLVYDAFLGYPPHGRLTIARIYFLCRVAWLSTSWLNRRAVRRVDVVFYFGNVSVQYGPRLCRFIVQRVMRARWVNAYLFCHESVHFRDVLVCSQWRLAEAIPRAFVRVDVWVPYGVYVFLCPFFLFNATGGFVYGSVAVDHFVVNFDRVSSNCELEAVRAAGPIKVERVGPGHYDEVRVPPRRDNYGRLNQRAFRFLFFGPVVCE